MRRFTVGVAVGLILGIATGASASYIGKEQWLRAPSGSDFHLGYVAGVIDTVQTLKTFSYTSRQTIAEGLDAIDRCTRPLKLGELATRAENVVNNGPATINVSDMILVDLVKCQ
jgi:hypothetical protein